MMSPDEIVMPLQAAVVEYFAGERWEMLLILGGSAVLAMLVAWMWIATRSEFALAFAATTLISALMMSAVAGSLLVRDKELSSLILHGIESPNRASVVNIERARIGVVASKYRYYRYGAAFIAALCVVGLMLSDRVWVHGIAAGLLILVVAQVLIDHYSERRAGIYLNSLGAM